MKSSTSLCLVAFLQGLRIFAVSEFTRRLRALARCSDSEDRETADGDTRQWSCRLAGKIQNDRRRPNSQTPRWKAAQCHSNKSDGAPAERPTTPPNALCRSSRQSDT